MADPKNNEKQSPLKAEGSVDPRDLDRREFLRKLGAVGLTGALALGGGAGAFKLWQRDHFVPGFQVEQGLHLPSFAIAPAKGEVTMSIAHGENYRAVVRAAIGGLGGISRFIKQGDVVVIKPNVAFDRGPDLAATTHPDTLAAVVELVKEAGAKEIRIADNPINSPAGCFLKSGILDVSNKMDLRLMLPDETSFAPLSLPGDKTEVLREWTLFHKPFVGATKVIGVAPCKDHNLCHASMTTKSWYGLLGGRRNQFHQYIHSIVSDFAVMMKPTFVVLDGMQTLRTNGPTGGRLSDVKKMNTIVAGTDMIAVDAYGYEKLMERDIAELTYLHKAHDRGLGTIDWRGTVWKEANA